MIDRTKLIEELAGTYCKIPRYEHAFKYGASAAFAHCDAEIAAAYEKGHAQGARFGKGYGREAAIADAELRGYERGKAEGDRWWARAWERYCSAAFNTMEPDGKLIAQLEQELDAKAREVLEGKG